jgi:hypothetical protein
MMSVSAAAVGPGCKLQTKLKSRVIGARAGKQIAH